ncbi:MAG: T9SS type A sorting domain-containing protein [Flavobacteriales bacterium]|nr:T9SS type A sorting domain-containing protein [Flavobacteriales bacterium]
MRIALLPFVLFSLALAAQPLGIGFYTHFETCSNSNGSVQAWVSGGVGPYTYLWSNNATTDSISGLSAGWHVLTVTDNIGTVKVDSTEVINIPDLGPYNGSGTYAGAAFSTGFGVPCEGECNGAMAMDDLFWLGTGPYSYTWSSSITQIGISVQGDPIFYGFCAEENITYTVYDQFGCSSNGFFQVTSIDSSFFARVDSVQEADCILDDGAVWISFPSWVADVYLYQGANLLDSTINEMYSTSFDGLEAGDYDLRVAYESSGCEHWLLFTVPGLGFGCNSVSGTVFVDTDDDCLQSGGEIGVPYTVLRMDPIGELAITGPNGSYYATLPDGNYTLTQLDTTLIAFCPQPQPFPFTIAGANVVMHIADSSTAPFDLSIAAVSGVARPGFNQNVWATISNESGYASGPITVTIALDPEVVYTTATPTPSSVAGNVLTWNLPFLPGFGAYQFHVVGVVTASLLETVTHVFDMSNTLTESTLANNTFTSARTVTGSYDPNDKTAFTSSGVSTTEYLIAQDEYIDYVIRFQNTGTDTAFTVVVTDTLAEELDMSSFQQGVASHPFTVAFKPGRVVEWRFENILLADSNTNEPASHGLVSFRIQPELPLLPGTLLENEADIFFDFNAPVRTNTSTLLASSGMGANDAQAQHAFVVFPNPASDQMTVVTNGFTAKFVRILSADGRSVQHQQATSDRVEVNIVALNAGAYIVEVVATDGTTYRQRVIVR